MLITILYDNTVYRAGLQADWGFSCLVEMAEKTILFDTGANGALLLENMKILGKDPALVDVVFISHAHFDHTGGLSAFLNVNNQVTLYAPVSFRGVRNAKQVIYMDSPTEMFGNVFSTGELDGMEQAMAVKTKKGLVLIAGCSHPRMDHILEAAATFGRVHGIIGGLHGFQDYALFRDFGLICPTHCTQHIAEIKRLYPDAYIQGGAGRVIDI